MTAQFQSPADLSSVGKCDFCNVTLDSDYEVTCHLSSNGHTIKRKEFLAKYTAERSSDLIEPLNLDEVLKSLKIYNIKDVETIANKGFFKINDDNVSIAEEFSNVLSITIHHYLINGFPKHIKDFLQKYDLEESMRSNKTATPRTTPAKDTGPIQQIIPDQSKDVASVSQIPTQQLKPQPVLLTPPSTSRPKTLTPRPAAPATSVPVATPTTTGPTVQTSVSSDGSGTKRRQLEAQVGSSSEPRPKKAKARIEPRPVDTGFIKPKTKQVTPEKDPTFVPVLAKIKVEPKDD